MFQQHLVELFLQNIPEELAVVFTSSVFLKVKMNKYKIISLGVLFGIIVHLIRMLPLTFGFHSIIMIFIFTLLFTKIYSKSILNSFFAVIKTALLLSIFEFIVINTYMFITGNTLDNMQNALYISLLMLPQTVLLFLVGLVILYYRHQQGVNHDQKNSKYVE